jgi:hypothetical protein
MRAKKQNKLKVKDLKAKKNPKGGKGDFQEITISKSTNKGTP